MQHQDFILKPLHYELSRAVVASNCVGSSISSSPLSDYIMDSAFIRMTGAQEQKLKCIVWSIASIDYSYRYERFTKKSLGECSCLDEKQTVYKDLVHLLSVKNILISDIDRESVLNETFNQFVDIIGNSVWAMWRPTEYRTFINFTSSLSKQCIMCDTTIFAKPDSCANKVKIQMGMSSKYECKNGLCLPSVFDIVYQQRNRIAHNTQSYQENLPSLHNLSSPNNKYENIFISIFLLMLIDNIFIFLFSKFLSIV